MIDYYEFLQISPHADAETIHRVYRYLATRLHPDNADSGNPEQFRLLKAAYDTLSDPASRAEYDATCRVGTKEENPLSNSIDFLDNVEGELNRRVALLALLYHQRRSNPRFPEVSLAEIERRMGFPRDYLDFTTWYLTKKGYITRADNSDFALTAEGVDHIESQRADLPVLNKLLTDGKGLPPAVSVRGQSQNKSHRDGSHSGNGTGHGSNGSKPVIVPASINVWLDRRQDGDRRRRKVDAQILAYERRTGMRDRRVNASDRRQNRQDRRAYAMLNSTTIQ